jgi:diguanylate cyclase (GGDEF)-like protein
MFRASGDPAAFRRHFARQVLFPIGILVVGVFALATFGLYWATRTSNNVSHQQQAEVALRSLSGAADRLAFEQQGITRRIQASGRLTQTPIDREWLDAEVGQWLSDVFRHDMTFILDARGDAIYAFVDGRSVSMTRFTAVASDLRPLIESVRHRAKGQAPLVPIPRARPTSRIGPDTIVESYPTQVGGLPAAASVMMIGSSREADAPRKPLLVSVRFIDAGYLGRIAAWASIDGLRFAARSDVAQGETSVEVKDPLGRHVGHLLWKPDLPGSRILRILGPITGALILLMGGTMGLLVRSLWKSARQLVATVVDLRASEAQAQHLAFHDVLTGLPNRALFQDRAEQGLARTRRGEPCAILALDLDRFKHVNDTLGHTAGDTLIREFATRLGGVVRETDTVARIGGDEFAILLCNINRTEAAEQLCERVIASVRQPFNLLGHEVFVGVSIGMVLAPQEGTDRNELVRKADIALYRAKAEGRDRYCLFTPSMDESVKLRGEIEDDLRRAIARGDEFEVYLQPEVAAGSQRILGLEALVRWNHPVRGMLYPDQFIPIAEESGLICPLGEWVLAQACRMSRQWPDLFIAVNLSGIQFRSPDLARRVITIARKAGCDPRRIELEITESVLLEENDVARTTLRELRAAGFRIALDDFGTGYSSLSYLRQFKVDKIKIDRSFTQNLGHDPEAAAIVTSVVTLGHAMGLTVTAEGVETHDQMQMLSMAGCNELQGYLFFRAMPEGAIADVLQAQQRVSCDDESEAVFGS